MQSKPSTVEGWTRASDLRAQVQKLWDRGELLAGLVTGQSPFAKRLSLKGPTSSDMMECFDDVRAWIQELQAVPHCRVAMREFKHRVLGANLVPNEVWIESLQEALALTGKQREACRFIALVESARKQQPELLDWLARRPFIALSSSRIGAVCWRPSRGLS